MFRRVKAYKNCANFDPSPYMMCTLQLKVLNVEHCTSVHGNQTLQLPDEHLRELKVRYK